MLFSSMIFLWLFFPAVICINYLIKPKYSKNLLLLVSLLFYAWGEPVYIWLMIASILFNYLCGLGIAFFQKRERPKLARAVP